MVLAVVSRGVRSPCVTSSGSSRAATAGSVTYAEAEAGDGDAELAGGEVEVELSLDLQRPCAARRSVVPLRAPAGDRAAPTAANSAATK